MPQRRSKPLAWRGLGLSDTLDSSSVFKGAMQSLQNLIPHPSSKTLWVCRPAGLSKFNFASAFTPPIGNVSLFKVIGNFAYGMVATNNFPGFDVPFVYNLATNAFVTITGVTSSNVPTSPPSSGAWTPPTAALIGSKLIITHPGFSGTGTNFVGVLNVASPTAPAWSTTQLTGTVTFTVPPNAVYQFNSRAYYLHNVVSQPAAIFSDALNPTNVTNANQVLTFGDNVPLTALGGVGLNTQLGGIIQSLIVFKGVQNIYQITGDPTTSNLSVNALNITTGTLAPNSVVNTPKGLAFMSPDGVRIIDFYTHVSDPVGIDGMGVTTPFIYSVVPSRAAAACGGNILRISTQNGFAPGSLNQEFWWDTARQIWTGPHTLPFNLLQPYNNTFVGAPNAAPNQIFQSDVVQSNVSTFVENGVQMQWLWATPLLPDIDEMTNICVTETSLDYQFSPSFPVVSAAWLTEQKVVIDSINIVASGESPTIWGGFQWGAAPWGGVSTFFSPLRIPWEHVLVFARGSFQANGSSSSSVIIGALHARYQVLGYLVNQVAAA